MCQTKVQRAPRRREGDVKQQRRERSIGLARALSKLGYCSRSQAAVLIGAGRVQLNGITRCDPETPVHMQRDRIEIDRRGIAAKAKIYLMLNKPRGIVTTASDEKGRDTVYSYLDKSLPWVAPVGRLDKASEGLLLLTNDSEWAAQVTAPESHLEKAYHVQINATQAETVAAQLEQGICVEGGEILRAKKVNLLRLGERNSWLEIVLYEGKNRQIRRMIEGCGIEVLRLVRVRIGSLQLGQLVKGACRALAANEKAALDAALRSSNRRP